MKKRKQKHRIERGMSVTVSLLGRNSGYQLFVSVCNGYNIVSNTTQWCNKFAMAFHMAGNSTFVFQKPAQAKKSKLYRHASSIPMYRGSLSMSRNGYIFVFTKQRIYTLCSIVNPRITAIDPYDAPWCIEIAGSLIAEWQLVVSEIHNITWLIISISVRECGAW